MHKGFQVVKVLRGSTLWYLHFPLTCERYLPAPAPRTCGDVPMPLGAESSGKWFAKWPSDTTCWALIDSCGPVKLGTKPYTDMTLAPACTEFLLSLPVHLDEHSGHRAPTNEDWLILKLIDHWSCLTDPETEPVTPQSMHLHTVFSSVQSNHSNKIYIQNSTRAECIPFSPIMERQ